MGYISALDASENGSRRMIEMYIATVNTNMTPISGVVSN